MLMCALILRLPAAAGRNHEKQHCRSNVDIYAMLRRFHSIIDSHFSLTASVISFWIALALYSFGDFSTLPFLAKCAWFLAYFLILDPLIAVVLYHHDSWGTRRPDA
jgi:hypothetical protein